MLNPFRPISKPKPIITSRPIFQHSSSFFNDDEGNYDSLKKPIAPLPLFYKSCGGTTPTKVKEFLDIQSPRPKPHNRVYLILHILNVIFTTTSLALFITTIPIWNKNLRHAESLLSTDYTDGFVLGPLIASFSISLYCLMIEHTTLKARLPIPMPHVRPKILVLMALTVLVTLAPLLTLSATNSLALAWQAPVFNSAGLIVCNLGNILSRPCQPVIYQIGELQIGAIVVGGLAWCMWVIVLAVATRDCIREKKELERAKRRERRERRRQRHEQRRARGEQLHRNISNDQKWPDCGMGPSEILDHGKTNHTLKSQTLPGQLYQSRTDNRNAPGHYACGANANKMSSVSLQSPAARLVAHKVKPTKTMQAWLNDRYI